MFTWLLQPHLPQPPEELIKRARELATNYTDCQNTALNTLDPKYLNRKIIKDNQTVNSRIQYGIDLGDDWHSWVKNNVMSDYISAGARISVGNNTTTHGAHADSWQRGKPCYKLYYLIDRGGEDATTYFFKEKGQDVERHGTPNNMVYVDDYSTLDVLDSVQFPLNQWVLLNTNILHGVENVTGLRLNFAIIFDTERIDLRLHNL